jgi:hypothetical protein
MIGAFVTFLVLFGLVKTFERKRDDLDNFNIATVAVVPVLSVILVRIVLSFVYPDPTLMALLPAAALIGLTFGLLWKNLDIPVGRSVIYTIVVLVVNEVLAFFLTSS